MDPRLSIVGERLSGIGRIVAVTGGKGGVGKSVLSSCLALSLARAGRKVGLLDLDLSSPSQHVILGARGLFPAEDRGILPPVFADIRFMSLSFFTGDRPAPLRGADISNAIIELLAITRWGGLDFLVVDMPPGLSDAALDVIRLMPRSEAVLVTVASRVSFETVGKVIGIFSELGVRMAGVVENMVRSESGYIQGETARLGVAYLGAIPFDEGLEEALGDPRRLARSGVMRELERIGAKAGWPVPNQAEADAISERATTPARNAL